MDKDKKNPQYHHVSVVVRSVFAPNGTRPLSRCYHYKMTLESLLNQFKSENSFLGRRTYPDK